MFWRKFNLRQLRPTLTPEARDIAFERDRQPQVVEPGWPKLTHHCAQLPGDSQHLAADRLQRDCVSNHLGLGCPALGQCSLALSDQASSQLIKHAFMRLRPCNVLPDVHLLVGCSHSYSMPSSHATNASAAAFHFTFFYPRWAPAFVFLMLLVGYTRVYCGVHYPFDVLVGFVVGLGAALAIRGLYRAGEGLLSRRRARAGAANRA